MPITQLVDNATLITKMGYQAESRELLCVLGTRCANNEALLKEMNSTLFQKTRSDEGDIKLEAIQSLNALWSKVGEPLLPFVAESVPFVFELLEDGTMEEACVHALN